MVDFEGRARADPGTPQRHPEGVAAARAEAHFSQTRGTLALWFGFLGAMFAWKLQLMVNYILVPFACWNELSLLIHLASLATLLLALAGGWIAWSSWRETGASLGGSTGDEGEIGGTLGRSRFMALAGLLLSGFFVVLILAQWLPNLLLNPCWT